MLDFSHNDFEVEINLTLLPKFFQVLNLRFNQLTGKIDSQILNKLSTRVMFEGNHIWIDSTPPDFLKQQPMPICKHKTQITVQSIN